MKIKLKDIIILAVESMADKWSLKNMPEIICEAPKHRVLGDLSTNIAMQVCKSVSGLDSMKTAEDIAQSLKYHLAQSDINSFISKIL